MTATRLRQFQNIVIDARGGKCGNGEPAAGYVTTTDLLGRLQYDRPVTLLVADRGIRVISKLLGSAVEPGVPLLGGRLVVHTRESYPTGSPTVDLYVAVADGHVFSRDPASILAFGPDAARQPGRIPVSDRTVRIVAPLIGPHFLRRTVVRVGRRRTRLRPPGLGRDDLGVYPDPVAQALRGRSATDLRTFVLQRVAEHPNASTREALLALHERRGLVGSEIGLAYGLGAADVQGQVASYLRGLVTAATDHATSFAVVTPSVFAQDEIPPELRDSIVHIHVSRGQTLPARANAGQVYVVEVDTLAHPLFIGLMASSTIPPVVAGDAALSAAIALRRPFVMTVLASNRKNSINLRRRLLAHAGPAEQDVLKTLFSGGRLYGRQVDLSQVLRIREPGFTRLFEEMGPEIDVFSDRLIEAATLAREVSAARR